jgi:hypothetical protein
VWTRLHGLVSLEIEGHFAPMGFHPALLCETEVDGLLDGPASDSDLEQTRTQQPSASDVTST